MAASFKVKNVKPAWDWKKWLGSYFGKTVWGTESPFQPSHFFQSQAGSTYLTLRDAATCVVVSLWVRYVAEGLLGHDSMTSKACTEFNYHAYAGSAPVQAADTTKRRLDNDRKAPNLLSPKPYELVFEDFLSRSSSCIHDNP